MRILPLVLLTLLLANSPLLAQKNTSNLWSPIPETSLQAKSLQRQIVPQAYKTLHLKVAEMQALLAKAPLWQTQAAEDKTVILELPMPDGSFQDFRIVEAPVMSPILAAKYPMIKSYAGIGVDDPTAYLRFDMTQRGFHAMVLSAEHSTVFIDPYSRADIDNYIAYYKKDFHKNDPFECLFDEVNDKPSKSPSPSGIEKAGDCQFRTYILALACTGEYAVAVTDVGQPVNVDTVLAAMVTTMVRVNGVYEKDASVHMQLHANTDTLIFLNAATDPYTNSNGSTMLAENQTTCDARIGSANYDIGHVFSTGGGGVAYLGAVCNSASPNNKAGGVTGQPNPVGDPFDIDYVAHEMGHQFGGNHTQNNACNRNNATAMEPGSASTIMGYAGICSPNVQNNSDDYFHAVSVGEIAAQITSGTNGGTGNGGNVCSTNTTFNNAPSTGAGLDYTIPRSTPFVLTATGSDPNGDPITYTWEQMDNAVATMPPAATNTGGPAFRSFKGTTSPNRYLPRLIDLVANTSPTWEVLSSVGRTYNWRVTVRDNHLGGGCTAEDNMVVTVNAASGPFVVTAPNTAVNWAALSSQTITWDVANTTAAPVSCANVDIFLSLDGGFTYPIALATGTPNDGSHTLSMPNNQTTQARVMVRGAGNIFFDISNTNFTISAPLNDFLFDVSPNSLAVCSPTPAVYDVTIGVSGTFSGSVTLAASGLPANATANFSVNPVTAPGSSQLTIGNIAAVAPGTYNITVSGTGTTGTQSEIVTLTVANGTPPAVTLTTPANGATGVGLLPQLTWASIAGASSYALQLATDAAFTNIVVNQAALLTNSYTVSPALNTNTIYYWRVRATNTCGQGDYSTTFSFTTPNVICTTFASTNVPVTISATGTPTVTSTLTIPANGLITDVNLLNLNIQHTYISDLVVKLKSPANTERTLLSQICGSQNNIITNFDDEAVNLYSALPCPPTNNGTYQPFQTLSNFDSQNLNGTWTLTISDVAADDGGSLQSWSTQVCYTPICTPPTVNAPTVTQPTCSVPTGTIVANATGGGTLEYSKDNGSTWQASATFPGLAAGSYTIRVRLQSDPACSAAYASNPVVINAAPTAPVVSAPTVTQPDCAAPAGTIVVNATGGGTLEYSKDNGATWQASNTFTSLPSGNYTLVARLQSSPACSTVYASNPVVINAAPATLVVSAPTVTQPDCAAPAGTIVVNATGTGTLEYSVDNGSTWQASNTFASLPSGNYNLVARLQSSPACSTAYSGNPVVLNAAPNAPVVFAPTVVQPTCLVSTGSILVNATAGGLMDFSIDNGVTWQISSLFVGLAPGSYNIAVRRQDNPACTVFYLNNPVVLSEAAGCCPSILAVNMFPIPNGPYDAVLDITSNGLVPSNGDVVFRAGDSIELQAGFEVELGGLFEILMQACQN